MLLQGGLAPAVTLTCCPLSPPQGGQEEGSSFCFLKDTGVENQGGVFGCWRGGSGAVTALGSCGPCRPGDVHFQDINTV